MKWQQTELSVPFPTIHGMIGVGKPSSTVPPAKEDISPQQLKPFCSFLFFPSLFSFHPPFSISVSELTSVTAFLMCVSANVCCFITQGVIGSSRCTKSLVCRNLTQFCLPSWNIVSSLLGIHTVVCVLAPLPPIAD